MKSLCTDGITLASFDLSASMQLQLYNTELEKEKKEKIYHIAEVEMDYKVS
jgi:hypothetical protein